MGELQRLIGLLNDAPVLSLSRFDVKRRELVLAVEPGNKGPLASTVGRAFPAHELAVLAADDALDLLDELRRPEYAGPLGGVRLVEPGRVCVDFRSGNKDLAIDVEGDGYSSTTYFDRPPEADRHGEVRRGGVWWGNERRRDALGRLWQRSFRDLVTDDFGTLVDSATGEAP